MSETTPEDSTDTVQPEGWPANQPDIRPGDWSRFAESDRQAGFEISENFQRFDQRNDMFNRAYWDEAVMSDHVTAFFDAYVNPSPKKVDGFTQWDYALLISAWSVAKDYSGRGHEHGRREGFLDPFQAFIDQAGGKAELTSPEETTFRVKKAAGFLGANLVGITEYDERWVYQNTADLTSEDRADKPNPLPDGVTNVIVLAHGMDYELVQSYPSALGASATGREYSREAAIATSLASFIHGLGYKAIASSNDTALTIPYAVKAGMGEYGRNQMVITPEFGPRVRFSKVFTDLPLAHDKPRKFGVTEFCNICNKCADACPPKALPFGPPEEGGANRSTISGVRKWSADCEKCFSYWTRMKADCAICMRVCPYNKDYSKWTMRLWRDLMGTALRKLMLKLDDTLGYGKRKSPKKWWSDRRGS
jgi:reductive dehalogenase